MPITRYAKCCYDLLKNMDERGKRTWANQIKELLMKYGFGLIWFEQGVGDVHAFVIQFKQRLKDCCQQEWYRTMHDQSKLSVYCTFKTLLEPEKYIYCLNSRKHMSAVARFRCSSHKLQIEQGRHSGTLLENRLCKFCEASDKIVIEDEFHFLLMCPVYDKIREMYIPYEYRQNVIYEKFIRIMTTDCEDIIRNLACYLVQANHLRQQMLQGL